MSAFDPKRTFAELSPATLDSSPTGSAESACDQRMTRTPPGDGGLAMRNGFVALLCAAVVAGCVTTETVEFKQRINQQAMVRDGVPGLVSTQKDSIVIARPAARQFQIGGRPVFIIAIYNRSKSPEDFRVSNVRVTQNVNGNDAQLKVITYEDLVSEEKTRQTLAAIGAGLRRRGKFNGRSSCRILQLELDRFHASRRLPSSNHRLQPSSGGNRAIKRERPERRIDLSDDRAWSGKHVHT